MYLKMQNIEERLLQKSSAIEIRQQQEMIL
jgi:hypothetical protein